MFTRPGKVDITMASLFRSVASPKSRKTKRREFDPKKCEVWYLFHLFGISGGSRFIIYIYIMHVLYIYMLYMYINWRSKIFQISAITCHFATLKCWNQSFVVSSSFRTKAPFTMFIRNTTSSMLCIIFVLCCFFFVLNSK